MNVFAFAVRQHQVGAFAFANDAAIVQIQRAGRILTHQRDSLRERKPVLLVIGDAEGGVQQACRVVIGGEDIQQA